MRRKELTISDISSGYVFVSAEKFKNHEKAENIYQAFQSVQQLILNVRLNMTKVKQTSGPLLTASVKTEGSFSLLLLM
jgi:hypothetical protein